MVGPEGGTSNPQGSQARTGAARSSRAIAGPSEARNSREIGKMVGLDGDSLNQLSDVFDELVNWNRILKDTSLRGPKPSP